MNVVAFRTKRDGKEWEDERWVLPMRREEMERDFEGWGCSVRSIFESYAEAGPLGAARSSAGEDVLRGEGVFAGGYGARVDAASGCGRGDGVGGCGRFVEAAGGGKECGEHRGAFRVYDRVRRPRSQRLVTTSRAAGWLYDFEGEGIGDDEKKIRVDLVSRYCWIWEEDLEMYLNEAKELRDEKAKLA